MSKSQHQGKHISGILLTIMVLFTLLSCFIAGYSWWLLQAKEQDEHQPEKRSLVLPVFMSLEPFTVNLIDDEKRDRVLYVDITLRLTSEETRKRLHDFMPEVRSRILLLLSRQNATELATDTGKVHLMSEIKQVLKPTFELEESEQIITDVLFTTFILR